MLSQVLDSLFQLILPEPRAISSDFMSSFHSFFQVLCEVMTLNWQHWEIAPSLSSLLKRLLHVFNAVDFFSVLRSVCLHLSVFVCWS